jgi:hypothetical protein
MASMLTTVDIPETPVVRFDGFRPDPEASAEVAMRSWLSNHPEVEAPHRVLGHNIDRSGGPAHDVDNVGYRLEVVVDASRWPDVDDADVGTVEEGRFACMVVEGSFDDDPQGRWITDGRRRLDEEMGPRGLDRHPSGRWYEEWLPSTGPGTVRLGLMAEIV